MQETTLKGIDEFSKFIRENEGAVIYFSTPTCNVCKVLKPKLVQILSNKFPSMSFAFVNAEESQELAAQNQVFTAPTILFYLDGNEFIRKSRNVNLTLLTEELDRPYSLMFE